MYYIVGVMWLLGLTGLSINVEAAGTRMDFHQQNIVDDCVARSIQPPSPRSIKTTMEAIHDTDVEEIDLSCNNFTAEGGCDVLDKASQESFFARTHPNVGVPHQRNQSN